MGTVPRLVAAIAGLVLLVPADATAEQARPISALFIAPVPCHLACPMGITQDHGLSAGACSEKPLAPPGSWDDIRVTVPEEVDGLQPERLWVHINPMFFYDLFICRVENPGTPDERYIQAAQGHILCLCGVQACHFPFVPFCPIGAGTSVEAGQVFVLRAYNVADGPIVSGWYRWVTES